MLKIPCREYDNSPAAYAHQKYDGHYTRIVKTNTGGVRCYSSQGNAVKLPARLILNVSTNVPNNYDLLAELYVAGGKSSAVKTAIIANDPRLSLAFFAIETWPATFSLEAVCDTFDRWYLPRAPFKRLEAGWSPAELLKEAAILGFEGWVLKDGNLLNWRKLKVKRTVDLICDSFIMGCGKYAGMIGSMVVKTVEGHIVCATSGFTDEQRKWITGCSESLIGMVCEIEFQYVGAGGKLRHPTFLRWRDDKLARDCTIAQDVELYEYYRPK